MTSNLNQVSIQDRTKSFAIRIIKACGWLDETPGIKRTLGKQLLRSGTSTPLERLLGDYYASGNLVVRIVELKQ